MKEQQTQTKLCVSAHSAENSTARSKDFPSKKSKKSLNASTASVVEEPVDLSLTSEITEEILNKEDVSAFGDVEFEKFTFVEDDITDNEDPQYEKLKNEIIEYVLQDLHRNALPEEGNQTRSQSHVLSQKKLLSPVLNIREN